jgi:hypothetical protein
MEGLSPRAADQTIRRDMLSILQPITEIDPGMFTILHGQSLETRPVGTAFEGVCRRDVLTLWYAPAVPNMSPSRDTPLRPYSIDAEPNFHIIHRPKADGLGAQVWRSECTALNDQARWFGAKDAFHAAQGALLLEAILDEIRIGRLKSAPCPHALDSQSCEKTILEFAALAKLDSAETCPSDTGSICYILNFEASTRLTIRALGNDKTIAPSGPFSVSVEQFLTVT